MRETDANSISNLPVAVALGKTEADEDSARVLADSLVRAFEYRHFHDVIGDIESVADDPENLTLLLTKLSEWRVLESRAILEVVNGRLHIVDKFGDMILNDAPETAHRRGDDNLHDLLASYPWLLNPEWQVLSEEKTLSKQLRDWAREDLDDGDGRRYDFLALSDERRLVVIEIKRPGHPVDYQEIQRMDAYRQKLSQARTEETRMMLVSGGTYNFKRKELKSWNERDDCKVTTWAALHDRVRGHYLHYQALLRQEVGDPNFALKRNEVLQTRRVLNSGSAWRGPESRDRGLGPQDAKLSEQDSNSGEDEGASLVEENSKGVS